MVDDGRLTALEERYASTAERVAALEARWQSLSEQYLAWRDGDAGSGELSLVEDREFPNAYAVLREQYEVDLELFEVEQKLLLFGEDLLELGFRKAVAQRKGHHQPDAPGGRPTLEGVAERVAGAVVQSVRPEASDQVEAGPELVPRKPHLDRLLFDLLQRLLVLDPMGDRLPHQFGARERRDRRGKPVRPT